MPLLCKKKCRRKVAPRFGNKPENHVSVSMTWQAMSHLLLMTQMHYQAWLTVFHQFKQRNSSRHTVGENSMFGDGFPVSIL